MAKRVFRLDSGLNSREVLGRARLDHPPKPIWRAAMQAFQFLLHHHVGLWRKVAGRTPIGDVVGASAGELLKPSAADRVDDAGDGKKVAVSHRDAVYSGAVWCQVLRLLDGRIVGDLKALRPLWRPLVPIRRPLSRSDCG